MSALAANPQLQFAPPGHFYSPLPDVTEVGSTQRRYDDIAGVDLREAGQHAFLDVIAQYLPEIPFDDEPGANRFGYINHFFGHSDSIVLYTMMRHFQPKRIIEVGSGHSSAVMLDTAERFLPEVSLTFVEPYPERLYSLIRENEQCDVVVDLVQNVETSRFEALEANDILFIDSSHVSKANSDVNDLFFRVLPILAKGVIVHIHDVLWPFEYPMPWIAEGRAWNEAYLLRSFLQFNNAFEVMYFNAFMGQQRSEAVQKKAPLMLKETGSSFWMRRVS